MSSSAPKECRADGAAPPRPIVLVMEDEALVAMMVEASLAEAGFASVWASDAARAAASFAGNGPQGGDQPRAAVVDIRLADGEDGRDVLRGLRARRPGLPAVVVTGFEARSPQADLRGLGGPTVRLAKPFDCDELVRRVAGMLDGSAPPAATPRRRASDARAQVAA